MQAIVKHNTAIQKYELWIAGNRISKSQHRGHFEYCWKRNRMPKMLGVTEIVYEDESTLVQTTVPEKDYNKLDSFNINERFDIMKSFVQLVATGITQSTIILGQGGLGKSHTVFEALKNLEFSQTKDKVEQLTSNVRNKSEDEMDIDEILAVQAHEDALKARETQYVLIKGYSTAKGLYKLLYENRKNLVVFDDVDSILKDATSIDLLKSALDSYAVRTVTWNNSHGDKGDLPSSFDFEGHAIFITNLRKDKVPQPLLSRCLVADVSMTRSEVLDRMEFIASTPEFMPEYSNDIKKDAIEFLMSQKDNHEIRELNLRSLISVAKIRAGDIPNWKRIALYALLNASKFD